MLTMRALLALAAALLALALAGCGGAVKPATSNGSRGHIDDPRTARSNRIKCLQSHHLLVRKIGGTQLQIGSQPAQVQVVFAPTPGAAQADQIRGSVQGAEVIGSALLYPGQAPDSELQKIEGCLAQGVVG